MSCCENSTSVVLFADGTRSDGTEEVVFDTKQAEKIYYFRDYDANYPVLTVTITSQSGGTLTNESNMGDGDINSLGSYATTTSGQNVILRFDFGTQVSRNASIVADFSFATLESRWAGTDLVFSTFASDTAAGSKSVVDLQFGTQTLRYVEIRITATINGGVSSDVWQIYDNLVSGGTSDVNIQVQNTITSNWFTVQTLSTISGLNLNSSEVLDTETAIQPNGTLTRIQLVNTDGWNGSVGALLVNPKFT